MLTAVMVGCCAHSRVKEIHRIHQMSKVNVANLDIETLLHTPKSVVVGDRLESHKMISE